MSALADLIPRYRRMTAGDLDAVLRIERAAYSHPWTPGNFDDSMAAGYHCWILECAGAIAGYSVVMIAAGEAHLLNLSIAPAWQRRGLGAELLGFVTRLAVDYGAEKIYLEARVSNAAGRALYARAGFSEIAVRRDYYPADDGREDAVVMERKL